MKESFQFSVSYSGLLRRRKMWSYVWTNSLSANFRNEQASFWPTFRYISSFNWTHSTEIKSGFKSQFGKRKWKICLSYRLLKKNWAVEILSPGTDLKTLHLHHVLHDQEHPTSPTHIHWRHRTVPRSNSAGGRSRPRQVGAECFHLLVSVLVVGSTPPILGDESTAQNAGVSTRSWS